MMEETEILKEPELKLRPEAVRERQDTYTSLTDLYSIDLFTPDFQAARRQADQEQQARTGFLLNSVFHEEMIQTEDADAQLTAQLFSGTTNALLLQSYTEEDNSISWLNILLILLSILFISGIYAIFELRKKRKEKAKNGYNNQHKKQNH